MTQSAAELKKLLEEIFEDSIVDSKERDALALATTHIPVEETLSVFTAFLSEKWGEAIADDVITSAERSLLGRIMCELNLELEHLPTQARLALKDVV